MPGICVELTRFVFTAVLLLLASIPAGAQMCKWVDEHGVVHYARECPGDEETEQVEISKPPPIHLSSSDDGMDDLLKGRDPDIAASSLSLERLGPEPENTRSRYLETDSAMIEVDVASLSGQFIIRLNATSRLPAGAFLAVRFPDPSNPGAAVTETSKYEALSPTIRIASRPFKGFKCWNYHLLVGVYENESKTRLLDTHEQLVQSRFDISRVRNEKQFTAAISGGGNCAQPNNPYKGMTAQQLDTLCERDREARLKPEREALIHRCKTVEKKDAAYCDRFYQDYGAARRVGLYMQPPMYSYLPSCIAARNARK